MRVMLGAMNRKWWVAFGLLWALSSWAGEPVETIQRLSGFRQLDVAQLLAGDILSERGTLMDFPNGISAQTCFAVPLPAAEVARRLTSWNPQPHPELKMLAFQVLPVPCQPADFSALHFDSPLRPIRWLVEKTLATTPTKSVLNLSQAEARELSRSLAGSKDPQRLTTSWSKLLAARVTALQQQGWAGGLPYEVADKTTSPVAQLHALLRDQAEVAMEFAPVLRTAGLLAGGSVDGALPPVYYWSWFEANHHATVTLGVVYQIQDGVRYQIADVEYYVSGDYYAAVSLYEVWPVAGGALIWRVDLFAAPMLEYTKGVERLAYEVLMVQEIKKETRCLLNDLKAK